VLEHAGIYGTDGEARAVYFCGAGAGNWPAIASRMRHDFARAPMLKAADTFELKAQESREREIVHAIRGWAN
jgi:hypothetical protein